MKSCLPNKGITQKLASVSWAIFLTVLFNSIIQVEWSHPYCNNPEDGPAHAAFGFPLPYTQYGGASSMEYLFMPSAYFFNVVFLGTLFFLCANFITQRVFRLSKLKRNLFYGFSFSLALIALLFELLLSGLYAVTVDSIGGDTHQSSYTSYRPIGISMTKDYDCKPSEFWFGSVKSLSKVPTLMK